MESDKLKIFNDPIHGTMEFHPLCVKIIDTPQFQRLRFLKQLGPCYYIYPGASHNRFEHSLGVSHLAGLLVKHLQKELQESRPESDVKIDEKDILCVQIAGLCHDLGHGPFSHSFDGEFIPTVRNQEYEEAMRKKTDKKEKSTDCEKWQHEEGSLRMFDHLIEENNLANDFNAYGLDAAQRNFIKELIHTKDGKPRIGRDSNKHFLYEVVANKRNGIDVDKWDYFARDSYFLGIRSNFDHLRYIKFLRVLKVDKEYQIRPRDKEVVNLYDMFYIRATLHRRAYQHKTSLIIGHMINEALVAADKELLFNGIKLSNTIDHMKAYTQVNDSVFHTIRYSDKEGLKTARGILEKIEKRQIYKYIGEFTVPANNLTPQSEGELPSAWDEAKSKTMKETIAKACSDCQISNLVIKLAHFDFGAKTENPINNVWFYSKLHPDAPKKSNEEWSSMLPKQFSEECVLLYSKERDPAIVKEIRTSFEAYCEKNNFTARF